MSDFVHYRCTACAFGGKIPLTQDEDEDLKQIVADACAALVVHAKGRNQHMEMRVKIDGVPGSYVLEVNPRDQWKGETAKNANPHRGSVE
jgi:hypothetical protein